ncbi:MAG: PQQ-binding-like beta-propeller repeat protein [Gemmatimonadota bacterium]|nr:PQQ-binding-like beta-propeller repeat protein [Gemmatimonadota bacterium]
MTSFPGIPRGILRRLPRTLTGAALLPDMTPEAFRKRTAAAFEGNAGRGPIEQRVTLGLVHHFTNNPDCARMFRDVLFYYEDLVKDRYGGAWCFEHMLFIYAWTWRLFYVWDLIEESDAFTDAERLRMTNLLWGLTHYVAGLGYFAGEEPPPPEIRQNHPTFAGLSMSFSAGYFRSYYGVEDFERELRFCKAIFDGQADCYKPNDDGGGGGYCWLVPNHQMVYDMKRDDFRYLEGGHLREIADYAILITDNLGSPVGFGDVGAYGARHSASPGVTSTLCKAAWYYNDGRYLWALDWMGGAPRHDCFFKSVPKRVADHMTGISIAPFNRPLYDWVERHGPGGANVAMREAFDKLTLRGGFEEEDLYLLLDGTSTFAHGHEDGNSIERLTWKGRMWLAETDYIWKRPKHHSSVVSICDGQSREMPSLVALKWAEDFGDAAFTRTVVPDYNGVAWTRDIFWLKGEFLLVADSLELLEDADYDLRCLWRTLGDVRLCACGLTVAQEGVSFRIQNADDSDKTLETEEARVSGQDPYGSYPYADGPIRIFEQRKTLHARPGDVERYFNLLVAGSEGETEAYRMDRVGEDRVRVEGPDGPVVFSVEEDGVRVAGIKLGSGATHDKIGFLDADGSGSPYVHRRAPAVNGFVPMEEPALGAVWEADAGGEVRCVDVRGNAIAVGTAGGRVVRLDAGGQVLWSRETGAEVRTAHLADPGKGGLLAGGRDCALTLFDGEGAVRWRRAFIGSHGRDQIVNAVRTADLTGDGQAEVVIATDGWLVWALGPDGKEIWQRQIEHHAAQSLVIGDVEGDGKQEVLVGTEYYTSNMLEADGTIRWTMRGGPCLAALALVDLDGDGVKESVYGSMDGNVYAVDSISGGVLWTANLGDDVRFAVPVKGGGLAAGSDSGNVALLSPGGERRWRRDLNAAVKGLVLLDDGNEAVIAAGTSEGWIVLLSLEGEVVGNQLLEGKVSALAALDLAGGPGLLAGTDRGAITALSRA